MFRIALSAEPHQKLHWDVRAAGTVIESPFWSGCGYGSYLPMGSPTSQADGKFTLLLSQVQEASPEIIGYSFTVSNQGALASIENHRTAREWPTPLSQ
jgi:hypothetical protein